MGDVVSLDRARDVPKRAQTKGTRKSSRNQFGNTRKLPSGRWQARYTGPDGKRHTAPVTFNTKGDANTWLAMRSAEVTEHRWKPPAPEAERLTFGNYARDWLAARELKPRTRAEYEHLLGKILPRFGSVVLADITLGDVRDWYGTLDPSKPTARAHAYSLLRTILGTAVSDELITANPCRLPRAGTAKRVKSIRPATVDELATLVEAMPERYRALVVLAAWCALRFGELTELRRVDLDLDRLVIKVRRAVTWPGGVATVGTPKSDAGVRDVTIPPHLVPMLRDHLDRWAQDGPDGLIFPNTEGEHMHHGSLYKVFKPARVKAGRPDLRFHDLRHTGAVLAATAGATLRELMDRLGHSTPQMAMRYQHVAEGRAAEIARRLSEMAGGAS